jgi:hypothetical protein
MRFMSRYGLRADRLLERAPFSKYVGFLLLAKVSRPGDAPVSVPSAEQTVTTS